MELKRHLCDLNSKESMNTRVMEYVIFILSFIFFFYIYLLYVVFYNEIFKNI